MKKTLIALFCIGLLLIVPACTFSKKANPPSDVVATQVAAILTSVPTATSEVSVTIPEVPSVTVTQPIIPSVTFSPSVSQTLMVTTQAITDTAVTLPSATPTATFSAADPRSSLGKATWERKTFSQGKDFGFYDKDNPETSVTVKNNMLVVTAKKADKFLGWTLSYPRPQDFYIETTITTGNCSGADQYGMIVRANNYDQSKGYFVGFTCDGRYDLNKWDGSTLDNLVPWKSAAGMNAGGKQTNRLGIMLKGNKLSIYANGNLLGEVNDSTYPNGGYFGLFIASANTVGFNIQLSDIAYWDLQ